MKAPPPPPRTHRGSRTSAGEARAVGHHHLGVAAGYGHLRVRVAAGGAASTSAALVEQRRRVPVGGSARVLELWRWPLGEQLLGCRLLALGGVDEA